MALGRVVVLLGEPGIGKTELTRQLAASLGASRIAAGTFCRAADPSVYNTAPDYPIILDGLDEVAASTAEPTIDKILGRLSTLNNPNVIISCRAADWTGASNRAKFQTDYGVSPVSVHILPFNNEQARSFLFRYDQRIDTDQLLSAIDHQGLDDLVGNPLTLRLLAEVWLQDAGLPTTKAGLLDRATVLLTSEENDAHDQSKQAQLSPEALSMAAGGMFAHLLLSGAIGIALNNRRKIADGFISLAEFDKHDPTSDAATVIKTRLFKPDAEDHMVPVHRVVAEYLAARWLSRKLDDKLSERRLFALLQFNGGVPSALRGLHAWIGYFSPNVRERCIDTDPYGFLRYGETNSLSVQSARHLLRALAKLADDDPYFRSEDWSVRSVSGLARPELKSEIVALITSPQRHVQLSALVLSSLAGSPMTNEVLPELIALMKDTSAPFVERSAASEALAKSELAIDWQKLVRELSAQPKLDSRRLAVETIGDVGPTQFSAETIADALIALNGLNESERREGRLLGSDYTLIHRTPVELARSILDCIALKIAAQPRPRHWHPGRSMTSAMERLLVTAIDGPPIEPKRFLSWVSRLEGRSNRGNEELNQVREYLLNDAAFRREVQRLVLYDETIDGGPWMAIAYELAKACPGLGLSVDDAIFFLNDIARAKDPTTHQHALWGDLVRATWRRDRAEENLQRVIDAGIQAHTELGAVFDLIRQPPARDYEAEEKQRQERYEAKQEAEFRKQRAQLRTHLAQIESGQHFGSLIWLAKGYLGRYSNLRNENDPRARLIGWVGEEIADGALRGFVAALKRNDLPDLEKICSIRTEDKHWTIEPVMLAGLAEIVRSGRSIVEVPENNVRAVLGIWWDMPEFNSTELGANIEKTLEAAVFSDEQRAETFVTTFIEPQFSASRQHISGLYRVAREPKFLPFSPKLALKWLRQFPKAPYESQLELIQLLLTRTDKIELTELIEERMGALDDLEEHCKRLWIAAAFCFVPSALNSMTGPISKELVWAIKAVVLPDRTERAGLPLPVDRYAAIVEAFAHDWPAVGHPSGGWSGDHNPWDASEFVSHCINAIGADRTAAGTEALELLTQELGSTGYLSQLKHVAQEQRRNRRDEEYPTPTFGAVKNILANAAPLTVSDLKEVMSDHIADVQKYLQDADTSGWEVFWNGDDPKIENTCRDRLLDLLRPRLASGIELFPELPMPDQNRVDIYASILGQGLPIEIKGQWHPEVWNASKTQLDERYCRDWRTDGRGIYLVLWFGRSASKNLPARPNGLPLPSNTEELRQQLVQSLGEGERSRIDILILDVSKPSPKATVAVAKKTRRKNT